jgi:hypothetical protein
MNQLIYVETSIPSFYFEIRLIVPENQARRNWTRRWWDKAQLEDTLVTSLAVINELSAAPEPKRTDALELIDKLTLLQDDPEVDDLVDAYIANKVMPSDATGDARHLALATWHNANKADHIHRINGRLGYETPKLITPLELLNEPL